MKVALSTIGKFHTFDLARQLEKHGVLSKVFSGYPMFKLKNECLPSEKIATFPYFHSLYMARGRFGINNKWLEHSLAWLAKETFDKHVAKNLPECDIFMGLSGSCYYSGLEAKRRGKFFICDRGSAHIRYQDKILREEYLLQNAEFCGIDPRIIVKEEAEYDLADIITVPSTFAKESFIEMGVPEEKLRVVQYGVNVSKFTKVAEPDDSEFKVVFVGNVTYQKGVPYLVEAFNKLDVPSKKLDVIGANLTSDGRAITAQYESDSISFMGKVDQGILRDYFSRSHVMVLPSVQEGLAVVQAQALACGCPVIGTDNTGLSDLIDEGCEGFVVPIRDSIAIHEKLNLIASDRMLRKKMSNSALLKVKTICGWDDYGTGIMNICHNLVNRK